MFRTAPTKIPLALRWHPDLLAQLRQVAGDERITLTEAVHRLCAEGLAAPALRAEVATLRERQAQVAGLLEQIEADSIDGHDELTRLRAQIERARAKAVMP